LSGDVSTEAKRPMRVRRVRERIPGRSRKKVEMEEEDEGKRQDEEEIRRIWWWWWWRRRRGIPTMVLVHERGGSRGCREGGSKRVETEPNVRPCDERGRAKSWSRNMECLQEQREELSMPPSLEDFV
jgi:hypothetical protein